jgi:DNA-binding XRE family transcriptional regulator
MPNDIRDRIRSERERLDLSVAQAAFLLGVSRQSYLQLEKKTLDPRLSTIVGLVSIGMRLEVLVPKAAKGRRR